MYGMRIDDQLIGRLQLDGSPEIGETEGDGAAVVDIARVSQQTHPRIRLVSWLIDIGGFAKKVKSTTLSSTDQIKDCGAYRECPNCHYRIDNSDVSPEWPGFPVGVKFDPSDAQLLEHLAAKCGMENTEPHMFIHEFIPTIDGDQGICYTHPENLPGAKKDGNSVHFFHRISNAYATGHRKRRKIHHEHGLSEEHVRWHKTGKTKPVMEDGVCKGYKKIMVLYVRTKDSKPYKSNWVMHQYHLGTDEKDGEYVVSKIFYQQQKLIDKNEENTVVEDSGDMISRTSPKTPKPNPPNPPRPGKSVGCDDNIDETVLLSPNQEIKPFPQESHAPPSDGNLEEDNTGGTGWLAGESQAVENDFDGLDDILLCNEILDSSSVFNDSGFNSSSTNGFACNTNGLAGSGHDNLSYGISDLDNLELDTPPDFQLSNLQYCSQDSILEWIDRL
ncbi:Suppressor of gamma response 1 [Senna tora]|uniref:Suppressor of gamma response 1 n=1 Tax=Senna tora TaxID=362788 RepID=A0A834TEF8_9FABA|nr:Suppressor of gamma response 1 [Senna tora]